MTNPNIQIDSTLVDFNSLFIQVQSILKVPHNDEIIKIKVLSGISVDFYIEDLQELYLNLCRTFRSNQINCKLIRLHYYRITDTGFLYSGVYDII